MKSWKNNKSSPIFIYTTLLSSMMFLSQSAWSLEILNENDLRKVDGQDGIAIDLGFDHIEIDKAYWEDRAGTANNVEDNLRIVANNIQINRNNAYQNGNYQLGGDIQLDIGSNGSQNGINFDVGIRPFTFSANSFQLCANSGASCDVAIGNFAIQGGSDSTLKLVTTDGLFNRNAQAELQIGLENLNIYTGLSTGIVNQYNQLILRNTNFNFLGKGVAYVDNAEGFVLHTNTGGLTGATASLSSTPNTTYGYVDLTRVQDPDQTLASRGTYNGSSAGLNLEFMTRRDVTINPNAPVYSIGTIGTNPTDTRGLIRVGASGRIVNGFLQIRGTNGLNNTNNILGHASAAGSTAPTSTDQNSSIIGSTGVALRLKGEFTASNDTMLGNNGKATTLEIGGAGTNTFGFEFGELSPLVVGSGQRAYFDSGNVYINLANTKHLQLPVNSVLNNSRFGGTAGSFLTSNTDYIQQIHNNSTNPSAIVMAIRGAEFQAISKRGRFTSSSGVSAENAIPANAGLQNSWGLGLPFHNLNANMAMYSTTKNVEVYNLNTTNNVISKSLIANAQRLGFSLAMSVDGKSATADKTTSILVIDGAPDPNNNGAPKNYYFGLRNVDMLLRGYGSIGFENGNLNVELPNLLIAMAAEVAAGYLPGANALTPANSFSLNNDILLGFKLKLLGDMNFSLLPHNQIAAQNGNRLSIIGGYRLTDGTVQLSDPIDGSMLGLDRMSGFVEFNNAIVINKDSVGFNYSLHFNPNRTAADVFRVRDINFYPPENKTNPNLTLPGQRLGEMVLTGGRLNAELNIKPF